MAISRKDSFTIQVLQLTDALLVWLSFWLGGILRIWLGISGADETVLESMNWVLYIAVPFTPLVLERFGFYDHLRHKTSNASAWQLTRLKGRRWPGNSQKRVEWIPGTRKDQLRVFTGLSTLPVT